ncbi:MAG: hypothetical protein ACTHOF_05385 [Flavisolibacter sp.]
MDKRETFDDLQKLKAILKTLWQQQSKASFLIDDNGLIRVDGVVSFIDEQADLNLAIVTIDGDNNILLKQIIAVNGQFRSDYTEC